MHRRSAIARPWFFAPAATPPARPAAAMALSLSVGPALALVTALAMALAIGGAGCSGQGKLDLPAPGPITSTWSAVDTTGGPWNLLFLTLDTTRRDRLGCYGYKGKITPNLDALAARGVLFEQAVTPVPITLPSHSTMMTGLIPPKHGVRNNGSFVLEGKYRTLAEILHDRGYATGATLGGIPLESRYGLNQGFDSYDDRFPHTSNVEEPEQRQADEITDLTLQWIRNERQQHPDQPFFHWAHYYDPHYPYEPPDPYRTQFANPYDGEIAFVDAQIGRLLDGLRSMNLLGRTWIVVVGDHGEGFGEHGEIYHSILVYRETMDVPLIIAPPEDWKGLPGANLKGRRVRQIVRLEDICPTLMNAFGFSQDKFPGEGASLLPLLAGRWDGPKVTYMESLVPNLKYGWCELRGARTDRWTYIRAPEPELYDLASDPAEKKNLYQKYPEIGKRLEAWCAYLCGNEVELKPQQLDEETMEKLRSLGYVGEVGASGSRVNNKDPKKYMDVFQATLNARTALDSHNPTSARQILEGALRRDPDNPEVNRLLASTLVQLGQPKDAIRRYQALRKLYPGSSQFSVDEAYAHLMAGEADAGIRLLKEVLDKEPLNSTALQLYPVALARNGRAAEAQAFFSDRVKSSAHPAADLVAWAQFDWSQELHKDAAGIADRALNADPKCQGAQTILGLYWFEQAGRNGGSQDASKLDLGALDRARGYLQQALAANPADAQAAPPMAWILQHDKKDQDAITLLIRVATGNPTNPMAQIEAGKALHLQGRVREALPYYDTAFRLGYFEPGFLANYGLACAAAGDPAHARDLLQRALASKPDPGLAQTIQRNLNSLMQGP